MNHQELHQLSRQQLIDLLICKSSELIRIADKKELQGANFSIKDCMNEIRLIKSVIDTKSFVAASVN